MIVEVKIPEIGEGVTEATIVEWFKEVGDSIEEKEILVEIMTDKVNVEIESPASGVVSEILHARDVEVKVGEVIAKIEVHDQS